MKSFIALSFAALLTLSAQQARAVDVTTSVVAGVVVAKFIGTAAGVAVSSVLAGAATATRAAGKEAIAKAALNDAQEFYLTGNMSLALSESIKAIQILDASISNEEAVDMIVEAAAQL